MTSTQLQEANVTKDVCKYGINVVSAGYLRVLVVVNRGTVLYYMLHSELISMDELINSVVLELGIGVTNKYNKSITTVDNITTLIYR